MYKRILVLVSEHPAGRTAVREGVDLAQAHGAEVTFLCLIPRFVVPVGDVLPAGGLSPEQFERDVKSRASRQLMAATVVAHKAEVRSRTALATGTDDAQCVVDAARKARCNLIVVGSEGRNAVMRLITSSVIPGLITLSGVPVMVCPDKRPRRKAVARRAAA